MNGAGRLAEGGQDLALGPRAAQSLGAPRLPLARPGVPLGFGHERVKNRHAELEGPGSQGGPGLSVSISLCDHD